MNKNANILIACEESGTVVQAFLDAGFTNVFSCDLLPTSGKHPDRHIMGDVLEVLDGDCLFSTQNNEMHDMIYKRWDLIIAHPPCTYLSAAGSCWFNEEKYGDRARERKRLRVEAIEFVKKIMDAPCPRICVENPVGSISTFIRKPDQFIQPFQFGEPFYKKTCLWLKGLPPLASTDIVDVDTGQFVYWKDKKTGKMKRQAKWYTDLRGMPADKRRTERSKTFKGIADAMAQQFGGAE